MQKSKIQPPTPKREVKTGMPVIDHSIFIFVFIWGKIRQDIRAFFLIVLLFFVFIIGYLYITESSSARLREDKIRADAKLESAEAMIRVEIQLKSANERIIALEKEFSAYQKVTNDRADAILDKVIALKSSKK